MIRKLVSVWAGAALAAVPAHAQTVCSDARLIAPSAQAACRNAARTATAAHAHLGALLAGGNPVPGGAQGAGKFRLGLLPGSSAGVSLRFAHGELPEVSGAEPARARGVGSVALGGVLAARLFNGLDAAPTLGGIGALELLGEASWLPRNDALRTSGSSLGFGLGARVGLLRESFVAPAVAASLVHRRIGRGSSGTVCGDAALAAGSEQGHGVRLDRGTCPADAAHAAEFDFNLRDTSARIAVSKRLGGLGLGAGGGYDWFAGRGGYGFRADQEQTFYRVSGASFESGRGSAFVDGLFTLPLLTFAAGAGWMQGGEAGTWFGTLGARVSL